MRGINKVIIVGTLGDDPTIRYNPNGKAMAALSVATSEAWTDKQSGNQETKTEWHRVVLWGRQAEIAGEYLKKGSRVYIEGKIQTRKWTDQQGQDRYTTEIIGKEMQFLDSKPQQKTPRQQQPVQQPAQQPQPAPGQFEFDDDIPF